MLHFWMAFWLELGFGAGVGGMGRGLLHGYFAAVRHILSRVKECAAGQGVGLWAQGPLLSS